MSIGRLALIISILSDRGDSYLGARLARNIVEHVEKSAGVGGHELAIKILCVSDGMVAVEALTIGVGRRGAEFTLEDDEMRTLGKVVFEARYEVMLGQSLVDLLSRGEDWARMRAARVFSTVPGALGASVASPRGLLVLGVIEEELGGGAWRGCGAVARVLLEEHGDLLWGEVLGLLRAGEGI